MPTFQTGTNVLVAFKEETTTGTAAGASGATQLRIATSPGLELKRAQIVSNERRSDSLKTMPRLGSKMVDGSYNCELSLATFDALLQAIMRSTYTAALASSQADFTSVTTGANSIIGASGSFLTKGFRVGDVVVLNATGGPAANNNRNLRVTSVTASTLGIAETLTVDATPRTTFTLNRGKKLSNPAVVTRHSFTIEEYYQDIDLSELFVGCRLVAMQFSCKPGQNVTAQLTFLGLDHQILTTGTSPYFTTPTLSTGLGLIADDSTIRYNGADVASFTGFDITFTIAAKTEPVIGSLVSPDVFDNDLTVAGTITALRSDLSHLTSLDAETEFETQIVLVENMAEPKNFISLFLPRAKFGAVTNQIGNDGAVPVTLPLLTGAKPTTSGYDAGVATIVTSAP